jgi:hypothetical protein
VGVGEWGRRVGKGRVGKESEKRRESGEERT